MFFIFRIVDVFDSWLFKSIHQQLVHLWRSLVSSTSSVARDPPLPACCAQSDEGGDHPRDNLNQTTPEILMKSTARL